MMTKIKHIDEVEIKNVKGISHKKYRVFVYPNTPNILVAPNGFGKSSLAAAFSALGANKLDLPDDCAHGGSTTAKPELTIFYTRESGAKELKTADESKNEIASHFGVYVIRSRLVPKARMFNISGRSIATPSIEVEDIVLINKIPDKSKIPYSLSATKVGFGVNGKVLPNLSSILSCNDIVCRIHEVDFSKESQVGSNSKITIFINHVNSLTGSAEQVLASVDPTQITELATIPHVEAVATALRHAAPSFKSDAELLLRCGCGL